MVTIDSRDRFGPSPILDDPKLSVGQVIGDTCRVFGRAWPYLLLLVSVTILIGIPVALWQAGLQTKVLEHPGQPMTPQMMAEYKSALKYTVPISILKLVVSVFAFAAISDGANRILEGGRFEFGRALKTASLRFFPLLANALLFYVVMVVGLALFIAPGLWAGAAFGLGPTLTVIERRGPFSGLSRSRALTRGNRWRCLATTLVFSLVVLAIAAFQFGAIRMFGYMAILYVTWASTLISLPLLYVFPTAMTVQLKRLKEGGSASQVARVF